MDEDFMLIRPMRTGFLMLIDRNTGTKTLPYQSLLDAEQRAYAETNDLPYFGDQLEYIERKGNLLLFKNQVVQDGRIYEYDLCGRAAKESEPADAR
ncbi:hypothetical protein D3C75_1279770 [compost metagenome]